MPKFFCNQCAALMETGDAFAPTELSCPACRGEAEASPKELSPMPLSAEEQALVTPPPLEEPTAPHPAAESPVRETLESPARTWRPLVRRAVAATLLGGILTFAGMFFTLWKAEISQPSYLFSGWVGTTMVLGAGLTLGLIAALVMLAFKKPFGRSFANAYSLTVLIVAVLVFLGGLLAIGANHLKQAQQATTDSPQDIPATMD